MSSFGLQAFILYHLIHVTHGYRTYLGCYIDSPNTRAMGSTTQMIRWRSSLERCETICRNNNQLKTYFGTEYKTECFCADSYARYGSSPDADCNTRCSGNWNQICGGDQRLSVYAVCKAGTWGQQCDNVCNCRNQIICPRRDGICSDGCEDGWKGRSCNEEVCSNSGCSHTCLSAGETYTCGCPEGFVLGSDHRTCSDIDECGRPSPPCQHYCSNTRGSYTCYCMTGYRLRRDRRTCVDINECAENTDECSGQCENIIGSYRCPCDSGFKLLPDGNTCSDCLVGTYGEGCSQKCSTNCWNSTCFPSNGTCSSGCIDGRLGDLCETEKHTSPERYLAASNLPIWAIVVIALLVCIVIALIVIVARKRHQQRYQPCRSFSSFFKPNRRYDWCN